MRVLLIAEEANPEWVSVPLEGWSHARALSAVADCHLVTHVRNAGALVRAGLRPEVDFTAIDADAVMRPLWKVAGVLRGGSNRGWTMVAATKSLGYYHFEHLLWKRLGGQIKAKRFELVHRLTPLSPTAPSVIARRCARAGVPFVLGPLNGGLPWPAGFDSQRRREREWLSYVRGAYRLMPGYRATRKYAAAIIAGSVETLRQVPRAYRDKCVYIPENAVDPARFTLEVSREPGLPLRAAFVGRLVPYKGADVLIEAAAPLVRAGKLVVDIIGDGPEMPALRGLVARLGVGQAVHLEGWVAHEKLQERLVQAEVLAFPSIREFGGAVVLEAMALGLVPIVVDYGGPGELVTAATGYKVPMGRREELIERLREILASLTEDPSVLRALGRKARERVRESFTWSAKAGQVLQVYRWVLGERSDKPDFGMPLADAVQVKSEGGVG